jgi:flagellar protein FlbD
MIKLTRLNRTFVILNSDLIEHIEETPDTVITLTSGQKLRVMESSEDIVVKVIEFRRTLADKMSCALAQTAPRTMFVQEYSTDGRH